MTLIIGTYQSHCKGEHNESEKKITRGICKSGSIFPYLQGSTI